MILSGGLCSVTMDYPSPIMSILMEFWMVFSHRLLFDMVSSLLKLRIQRRDLLMKDWSLLLPTSCQS
jgi:hypothetical protein